MIRVVALCVFRRGESILVTEGVDPVTRARFARPIGGAVEEGERSADAVVREVREEIEREVTALRLLGVLENHFTYQGRPGHEIVFVYEAQFVDADAYERAELPMREPGWDSPALWRRLDAFGPDCRLVPEGLAELLRGAERPDG